MTNVLKTLNAAFSIPRTPLLSLPPQLLLAGANIRPGLSPRSIASRVISRQSEAGAPAGDIFSEETNVMESMITIIIQEVIDSLQTDAKIEIVIPPGVQVMTTGAGNLGGPVVSQGVTTNIAKGSGVIR